MSAKKVLIVEDEVDLVETIRFLLEKEGYRVLVSGDGEDALHQAQGENPHLIILDIMLPKLDGYKVCRQLKSDKRYKQIPILMLTARAQQKDRIIGMEAGADEYIIKPFDLAAFMEKVKTYLRKEE
jgi:DNA-binding response OmpR family regulator